MSREWRTAMGAARPQHPPLPCARETAADGGRVWALRRNTTISGTEPRGRRGAQAACKLDVGKTDAQKERKLSHALLGRRGSLVASAGAVYAPARAKNILPH